MPTAAVIKGTTYAVHSDHLNTPRKLTQANGQVAWQWAYSAFGDEQPTLGAKRFTSETTTPPTGTTSIPEVTFNLRYPGQYFDKETKLHYNYHRSYDSRTGRYTQGDPIGLDGGWNRFGYVGGNPLSRIDPKGLDFWVEGSVEGEGGHPFHRSVCVGKYAGGRLCISFGVAEDECLMNCKGEVYEDTSAAGPLVPNHFQSSSAAQDAEIEAYFRSLLGRQGRYFLLGNNCRDFSERIYGDLRKKYGYGSPFTSGPFWR